MKTIFLLALIILSVNLFSQDYSRQVVDYEGFTMDVINKLSDKFNKNETDSIDIIIDDWVNACSISECTQRLIIINEILSNRESTASILTYFENGFHRVYQNRIYDSKKINYAYFYSASKAYFGYVPLKHPIDSIINKISNDLLQSQNLTLDERLICILFSGDIEKLDMEMKQRKYKDSKIKQYLLKQRRKSANSSMAFTLYGGIFRPISSDDIFTYSPMFGLTFGSSFTRKLIIDIGLKFRININDKYFKYYALGDTNSVNSDYSLFGGAIFSYKLYENKKFILLPRLGIGYELVYTGLSEQKTNSNNKKNYNVETLHLSLGLSIMTPVFRTNYVGFGINYHYCPYQWDTDLHSKFENNLLSAEIFFCF